MAVLAPRRADLRGAGDEWLAALAGSGDEQAFEAIFERHHRGLLSLCRHLLGSLEEAEDALQHTFAAAYRQLTEGEAPQHLRAWLYTTARNRCTDILRSRREVPAPAPEVSTAGLAEEVERRSDLRELVSDIGRLPDDQRAALVLSEIEDLAHAEVADVLGCRRDKVRALVYQARSSLAGWREARQLPCREVREEIAVAHGGGLRRAHLRRHLKLCAGCAEFRKDMDRQRRSVALVLPCWRRRG
jgi:RNA polymerase sigma factor (sigma-70 family)